MIAVAKQTNTEETLAKHSVAARAQRDFESRCELLRQRLGEDDFLRNKGIGNEVGYFTFCYDPSLEMQARAFFAQLQREGEAGKLPCNLIVRNLYDVFLSLCERKRITQAIPKQELKTGSAKQLRQLQKVCSPQAIAKELEYSPHNVGDVLLITGVGEIYPLLRVHTLLDNMHASFGDIPVIVSYPGSFTGANFHLFNRLGDGNYYRAFDLSRGLE